MLLPEGVEVTQWSLLGSSPLDYPQPTIELFPIDRVATLDLSATVKDLATVSAAINVLSEVRGVIDVDVVSVQLDEESLSYTTVFTVSYSIEVLEGRFADGWQPENIASEEPADEGDDPETLGDAEEGDE